MHGKKVKDFVNEHKTETNKVYISKELCEKACDILISDSKDFLDVKMGGCYDSVPVRVRYPLMELFYGHGCGYQSYEGLDVALGMVLNNDSWEANRDFWDSWWYQAGNSNDGYDDARDAMFETFVKGTMVFRYPWQLGGEEQGKSVFDRKYSLFYKEGQGYKNGGIMKRTSSNEEEIFSRVGEMSGRYSCAI